MKVKPDCSSNRCTQIVDPEVRQCGPVSSFGVDVSSSLLSRYLHTASAAASCNLQRCHPSSETLMTSHLVQMVPHQHVKQWETSTYWDVSVKWFPISLHIGLSDVQHVHLRAGHHDADEGPVHGSCSLSKHRHVPLHSVQRANTRSHDLHPHFLPQPPFLSVQEMAVVPSWPCEAALQSRQGCPWCISLWKKEKEREKESNKMFGSIFT